MLQSAIIDYFVFLSCSRHLALPLLPIGPIGSMHTMVSSKYLLFTNLLLDSICWSVLIPALPGMHKSLGLSTITVGSISSLVSTLTFVTGVAQGRLADSLGRFRMLRLSLLTQLVGHLIMIASLHFKSSALFILARCIQASCKCAMVVSQAILHDISQRGEKIKNLATLLAFSNIAYIIGPTLGGQLYAWNEYYPSEAASLMVVLALLLLHHTESALAKEFSYHDSTHLAQPSNSDKKSTVKAGVEKEGVPNRSSLFHYLHLKFAFQIGNALFESLLAQHSQAMMGLTSGALGLVLSWTGVASAMTNLFILKALARWEDHDLARCLSPLSVMLGLGLTLWALARSLPLLMVAVSLITVSSNIFLGILQGLISHAQTPLASSSSASIPAASSWTVVAVAEGAHSDSSGEETPPSPEKRSASNSEEIASLEESVSRKLLSLASERDLRTSMLTASQLLENDPSSVKEEDEVRNKSERSSGSKKGSRSSSGTVYGLSSTADRAARIVSPLVGSVLLERYGSLGLVYMAGTVLLYCLSLLHLSPYRSDQQHKRKVD
eukprot:gene7681-8488_t